MYRVAILQLVMQSYATLSVYLTLLHSGYMTNLIATDKGKVRYFHSTKRFIDDLCAVNDGNLFGTVYKDIYPDELELKVEHSCTHASFLNLDITITDGVIRQT